MSRPRAARPEGWPQVLLRLTARSPQEIMRLPGRSAAAVSVRCCRCISVQRLRFAAASFRLQAGAVLDRGLMKNRRGRFWGAARPFQLVGSSIPYRSERSTFACGCSPGHHAATQLRRLRAALQQSLSDKNIPGRQSRGGGLERLARIAGGFGHFLACAFVEDFAHQ